MNVNQIGIFTNKFPPPIDRGIYEMGRTKSADRLIIYQGDFTITRGSELKRKSLTP
jgi:hypothetical protein